MKIKFIMLASLLLLSSAFTCVAQVDPKPNGPVGAGNVPNTPPPSVSILPDLIVTKVESNNLDSGEVLVTVKNQGAGKAAGAFLALIMNVGSQTSKTTTLPQPALASTESATITFKFGYGLSQVKYCARTDRSNTVKESNEGNNQNCGQFSGKP